MTEPPPRPQYRRISRTLHDRCTSACLACAEKLTPDEVRVLSAVAAGFLGELTVTKADVDAAKAILEQIGL